jgi:hypothetical protein
MNCKRTRRNPPPHIEPLSVRHKLSLNMRDVCMCRPHDWISVPLTTAQSCEDEVVIGSICDHNSAFRFAVSYQTKTQAYWASPTQEFRFYTSSISDCLFINFTLCIKCWDWALFDVSVSMNTVGREDMTYFTLHAYRKPSHSHASPYKGTVGILNMRNSLCKLFLVTYLFYI